MNIDQQAEGIKTGSALLMQKLAEPFPADEVKCKPQTVKGNRALAIHYIGARQVMDRLDAVMGPDGWEDEYALLADGSVVCTIRVRIGENWIRKTDVGGPSEQPDSGDRMKSAFSDAFKRAAVKLGIGRYLYRLPQVWADYDPQNRRFTTPPKLPDWALPKPAGKPQTATPPTSQVRGNEQPNPMNRPVIHGVQRLTDSETQMVSGLLERKRIDVQSFLAHYDIPRICDLPATKYKEACERLNKKSDQNTPAAA